MADTHDFAAAVELEHFEVSAVRQVAAVVDILADNLAVDVAAAQRVEAVQVLVLDSAAPALLGDDYLTDAVAAQV